MMEDFDRQLKAKINSLDKVPGVEFDEARVWSKIKLGLGGNLSLLGGAMIMLTVFTIIFIARPENQTKLAKDDQPKKDASESLIASNILQDDGSAAVEELQTQNLVETKVVQITEESLLPKKELQGISSSKYFEVKPSDKSQRNVVQISPTSALEEAPSAPVFEALSRTNETEKEFSISAGRGNQKVAITHLRKIDDHFSLTYGFQVARNFDLRFRSNESAFLNPTTHHIQFPLGVRYNLYSKKNRFKMHVSTDFVSSFLTSPYTPAVDYSLSLESYLRLDYRFFSGRNGKEGFVGFRLPLFNRNMINGGAHKPSLYDLLKQ